MGLRDLLGVGFLKLEAIHSVALDCDLDWEIDPNWQHYFQTLVTSHLELFKTSFPVVFIHLAECKNGKIFLKRLQERLRWKKIRKTELKVIKD